MIENQHFSQGSSMNGKTIRWKVDGELDILTVPKYLSMDCIHTGHKRKM